MQGEVSVRHRGGLPLNLACDSLWIELVEEEQEERMERGGCFDSESVLELAASGGSQGNLPRERKEGSLKHPPATGKVMLLYPAHPHALKDAL